LDPNTEKALQLVLGVRSNFWICRVQPRPDIFPRSAPELRRAETTDFASQLEAYLQAAQVEQLPENDDVVAQTVRQDIGAHGNYPGDSSPSADVDIMMIIPCPEITVEDVEHTFTSIIHFVSPQNISKIELICSMLMSETLAKLNPYTTIVWQQCALHE
jgi:hypothetical protein